MYFCFSLHRYYFKKVSDEFDCGVVFEEIREDDAILPIFEEKIIGKVEKIDWRSGRRRRQHREIAWPFRRSYLAASKGRELKGGADGWYSACLGGWERDEGREIESERRGVWEHCGMYSIDSKASTSALEPSLVPHRCPVLLVTVVCSLWTLGQGSTHSPFWCISNFEM